MHPGRATLPAALSLLVAASSVVLTVETTRAEPSVPQACGQVPSPNVGTLDNQLYAVSAGSATDAWAVGGYMIEPGIWGTLTLHWDGVSWTVVPSPGVPGGIDYLYGVDMVSSSDVWAVGESGGFPYEALILHWDGTEWTMFTPPQTNGSTHLYSVTAVSPNDVWAVGFDVDGALAMHWDGISWTVKRAGLAGDVATGVDALGQNDVWAVGYQNILFDTVPRSSQWDGSRWNSVSMPGRGQISRVESVAAISSSDAWAAGFWQRNDGSAARPLTERWDGSAWTIVPAPSAAGSWTILEGVAATGPQRAWAAGYVEDLSDSTIRTLVLRWNGIAWGRLATPSPGSHSYLLGVDAGRASVWSVGYWFDIPSETDSQTLIVRCGP